MNPNGRTPVLDDDGFILAESKAILAYLARGSRFVPDDHRQWALVLQWLFFEQYSHEPYIATSPGIGMSKCSATQRSFYVLRKVQSSKKRLGVEVIFT